MTSSKVKRSVLVRLSLSGGCLVSDLAEFVASVPSWARVSVTDNGELCADWNAKHYEITVPRELS